MLASTALISRTPKPVCVLRCFGRNGSITPGAGTLAETGGFDNEDIVRTGREENCKQLKKARPMPTTLTREKIEQ